MSIFNNTEENYWRNLATKTVLVCITVAIIVWFLPRNEGRMYRYDVGKPWMYGSVIAKFDFPIYKTDEAIKHEQIPARLRAGHQRSAQRICRHRGKTDAGNIPDGHHQHQRIQQHLQGLHQHDTIREW